MLILLSFFFSSRRRHTRCALVTGVQTCALPIFARAHIKRQVPDRTLRAKLTPNYTIGCKRVLISNDYYPSLTQPNVDVVTDEVREIRGNAVITTDGKSREVDAIILGTGFTVQDPIPRGAIRSEARRGGKECVRT